MSAAAVPGYDNGTKANFDCGMDAAGRHAYEIYGSTGTIRVGRIYVPQEDGDASVERITSYQYPNGVAHFAGCVLANRTPDYSPDDVPANMRALGTCIESLTASGIVELEKH